MTTTILNVGTAQLWRRICDQVLYPVWNPIHVQIRWEIADRIGIPVISRVQDQIAEDSKCKS